MESRATEVVNDNYIKRFIIFLQQFKPYEEILQKRGNMR
jgi:hypothetical protein